MPTIRQQGGSARLTATPPARTNTIGALAFNATGNKVFKVTVNNPAGRWPEQSLQYRDHL